MSDTIELTETSRLRIEYDTDAECPRGDWDMLTGFVKIQGRGDSRLMDVPAVHPDVYRLAEAHERMYENVEENVPRYAQIFHDTHVEYDSEHGGYWFVDPQQMRENWPGPDYPEGRTKAEQEALVIEQEQETYRQWADGEVYGVILERKVVWGRLSEDGGTLLQGEGTTRETWEEAGSLWGCYLDDEYTPQEVAKESFDLTENEEKALS